MRHCVVMGYVFNSKNSKSKIGNNLVNNSDYSRPRKRAGRHGKGQGGRSALSLNLTTKF